MRTTIDCIPCFLNQSIEAARMATTEESKQVEVVKQVMNHLQTIDFTCSPPEISKHVHHIIRTVTGNNDPYKTVKMKANKFAKKQYPMLKRMVDKSTDPLLLSTKLAIIGNVIDFGTMNRMDVTEMITSIAQRAIDDVAYSQFKQRINEAETIVYLADNTGEIFFDRLLLEQITKKDQSVTYVVKQHPIINDATHKDALYAGIDAYAHIIAGDKEAPYSAPGIIASNMSTELKTLLHNTDMVISKGQGNYESLNNVDREIFFLLMIKCPRVAESIGIDVGTMVLKVTS
ncbi:MAG: ARMT1-like domain-containing protein [Candidatus Thermoplasmatota archaeon]|nr:ARMT1-like domain-containing protein [Candidatus Thermoplasmatota archaeon]